MFEYRDMTEATDPIGHFIEEVYNRKRLHSTIGYLPPVEFEQSLLKQQRTSTTCAISGVQYTNNPRHNAITTITHVLCGLVCL